MDLKLCPHCGGTANLYQDYNRKYKCYFLYVKCDLCGAQGKIVSTKNDCDIQKDGQAVDAWNMRYNEP